MADPTNPLGRLEPTERTYILEGGALPASFSPREEDSVPQLAAPPISAPQLEQVDSVEDHKREKSSILFTSANYVNSIVGSGVIGMPFALHEAGFGFGMVLLAVVAFVTDRSLVLLVAAGKVAEVNTYQDLVRGAFGTPGYVVCSFLQFMYPFISLISYNIIVGDTLTKVLIRVTGISPSSVLARREFIMTAATVIITVPLSLYRNIAHLSKVSLTSVFLITAIALAMLSRIPVMADLTAGTGEPWRFANSNLASAIGIMSFAFMCHHSSFMVYESLADNTQVRWDKATHISILVATILTAIFAIAGYVPFTGSVQGDVFENYCWGDDLMNICRGLYAFTILLTFPIECFVARDVLETTFFSLRQPQPFSRHAMLTVAIVVLVMLFSLSTDCLGVVLELNGILVAIPLAFILPGLSYIKVIGGPIMGRDKFPAWGVVGFGTVSLLAGFITLMMNLSTVTQCSHGKQMDYCFEEVNGTEVPIQF